MPSFSSKNRFIALLIIFFIFVIFPINQARGEISTGDKLKCAAIGSISPSQAIKCVLDQMGINENTLTETTAALKVLDVKKQSPQVELAFTPTNPAPGEEATATAQTLYFSNNTDSLYYTWYLQTADCPPNPDLNDDFKKLYPAGEALDLKCNLNKDHDTIDEKSYGIVDVEDYKIKAMRIYASNGFETSEGDYSQSDGGSAYQAIQGGDDQKDKANHCFFYDTNLGKQYEFRDCFHLFPDILPGHPTGENSFNYKDANGTYVVEKFWHTNPDDPDTAETGHPDEANVVGLNARNFTWTYQSGDQIGVAVEGVSVDPTLYTDSSYKIMWALPNNTCKALQDNQGTYDEYLDKDALKVDAENTTAADYEAQVDPEQYPDCPDGCEFTRTLVKRKPVDKEQAPSSSYTIGSYQYFVKTETIKLPSRRRTNISTVATGGTGGTAPTGGDASVDVGTTTLALVTPGDESDPSCNEVDTASLVSSDFFTQEEADSDVKYRVELSGNHSCCDPGYISQDELQPPDLTEVPEVPPEDPGYQDWLDYQESIADNTAICTTISSKVEIVDSSELSTDSIFNMSKKSFNRCLLENLLTPTEGGGKNEKIDVSLSSSPANPVNDTSAEGDNADWISVVSTIENSTKSESLHYIWNVYAGDSADSDGEWGDPLLKSQLVGVEQTVGAGIPNLKFKANFGDAPKYLKVKLNVSEKVTSGTGEGTRKGHAEVIIPLSSFNNKLTLKRAAVSDSLVLSPGIEICKTLAAADPTTLVDAAVCQVAPDEIVAVEANISPEGDETLGTFDFLWTLNDQNLSYKYAGESFTEPGKLIYFPVLAAKGSTLNLSLTATSQISGRKISLAKTFLVSEPTFKIISSDESTSKPKTLGYYTGLDSTKQYPDYSQTEFLALKDSSVKLALAQFAAYPFPNADDLPIKWSWNDTQLTDAGYSLPAFSTAGLDSSFSLKAEGVYTQDNNTKKALRNYWGVTLGEFYEQQLSQTIDFTLADSIDGSTTSQKGQGKILASFISSVPAYFAFLFRLVMTAFVLLATVWILFALFPQIQNND